MITKTHSHGFWTIGEVAKKMGVSVRTLQFYDQKGLLSPSKTSEGGRRIYSDKDIIKLHQILSLKHLGFSLDDIKNRLISLDTPDEVANVLKEQAALLKEKIDRLTESLSEIEKLCDEVVQMKTVDFKKYADIIVNLQLKNDFYWLIKHFDEPTLNHIRNRFDKDSGTLFMQTFMRLQDQAIQLQRNRISPGSEKGQNFAKAYWNMITEFTEGDQTLLSKLIALGHSDQFGNQWKEKQDIVNAFIEPALDIYFSNLGMNPFQEESINE